MELLLEKTSYEDFDDWMQDFAKRKRILLSYDSTGIAHSLEVSPRRGAKRIFIAKTSPSGIAFDHECYFSLRKAGNNLQVFPGVVKGPNITASTALLESIILEVQRAWGLKVDPSQDHRNQAIIHEPSGPKHNDESNQYKLPKEQRKELVNQYRSEYAKGNIPNKAAWAENHDICFKTLKRYEAEFPE